MRRVRRRPSPSSRRGSVPRLQGICAVLSCPTTPLRSLRRRAAATSLATLVGVLVALTLPAPAFAAPTPPTFGPSIEVLSPYQGQSTCDPVARPGVVAFRQLVLSNYATTGDSGIVRVCSAGGTSEHKEGRAWDWRVNTSNPAQVLQVDDLMTWLLAADEHGSTAAMARRLGIMYMIWNKRVWKSYQASMGWQAYVGPSEHSDHVHVSFSWAGAYGATSYWSGKVAPVMAAPVKVVLPSTTPTATIALTPVQRQARVEVRRGAVASLPGPWKRH